MWIAILGPLAVHDGETQIDVPRGRLRVLLAALLVHAGAPVAADALAEVVWDGSPPSGAAVTLRSHVVRLRRVLGPRVGARLVTRYPGYLLQAGEDEVDALRFRRLTQDGGTALRGGDWARADRLLGEALNLWRGVALADVASESLRQDEGQDLEAMRLQAEEWRADAALHLGRHAELVPRLQSLATQHPLRERFHAQLTLALYRCDRQAEALAAYHRARDVLVEQLGVEPGPGLQELHQRILSADPALTVTGPPGLTEREPQPEVPRELPPTVRGFTGRAAELRALTGLLDRPGEQAPGTVVISAIGGTAGVGKTALAVHWAHQAAGRFPDGQLYVNLRGYDPDQPVSPADALAGFLRSMGVPSQDIPPEPGQRAARYRSLLAGKRMLVVLDNAGSADQIRALLPGTPACTVVVTSRDALAGLVARDGAARLDLDVLPLDDAVALLRTLIGERVDAEPGAAEELSGQCCRLPLALRVAAELAVARPAIPLAGLTRELADLRQRLDQLEAGGDPGTDVRAVFSWSYRHLGADAARAFRLLGLHPGPDFEPYAAAALTDTTLRHASQLLNALVGAHLIQPAAAGRYSMHDLLRGYACELAAALDGGEGQQAALTRLFDHYLQHTAAAMDILFPAERGGRPPMPRPATPVLPLAGLTAAREWLDGERAVLVTAAGHAAVHGWPGHATRLAATLLRYLHTGGYYPEAVTVCTHALDAARRTGDRAAEATALNQIGVINAEQGRHQHAAGHHQQALALFRQAGDRDGEARALTNLGIDETQLGHYEQAARHQQQALAIRRDLGNRLGEARALSNLGFTRRLQGRYQEAAGHYRGSLDRFREIGDRQGEAWSLAQLGVIDLRTGRHQQAAVSLERALAAFHEMGHVGSEAECLIWLGEVYRGLGRYRHATGNFEQALAVSSEIGDPNLEAEALNGLGDLLCRTGNAGGAHARHAAALRLATEADVPLQQASAHTGLARACQAAGDPVQARHHWQEALTRYDALGAPQAEEIRARLAGAGDGHDESD